LCTFSYPILDQVEITDELYGSLVGDFFIRYWGGGTNNLEKEK
jgi:hypothetical protein